MSSDWLYSGSHFSGLSLMLWGASLLFKRSLAQTPNPIFRIKSCKIIGSMTDLTFQVQFMVFFYSFITSTGQSFHSTIPIYPEIANYDP